MLDVAGKSATGNSTSGVAACAASAPAPAPARATAAATAAKMRISTQESTSERGYDVPRTRGARWYGEVSERSKERDWKSRTCCKVRRGFKSRPLRFFGRCGHAAPAMHV